MAEPVAIVTPDLYKQIQRFRRMRKRSNACLEFKATEERDNALSSPSSSSESEEHDQLRGGSKRVRTLEMEAASALSMLWPDNAGYQRNPHNQEPVESC
mmetsp:Transcript_5172/g.10083  ORF Transcript_5172/g.10083 Transcript_5172/m.10083 type:complete len:99 (+) Transcript_5172:72-368(+)